MMLKHALIRIRCMHKPIQLKCSLNFLFLIRSSTCRLEHWAWEVEFARMRMCWYFLPYRQTMLKLCKINRWAVSAHWNYSHFVVPQQLLWTNSKSIQIVDKIWIKIRLKSFCHAKSLMPKSKHNMQHSMFQCIESFCFIVEIIMTSFVSAKNPFA